MKREYKVISSVDEELLCSICSDVFYKPVKTDCGHIFCGKCLINWLKIKKTCPFCRQKVVGYEGDLRVAKKSEKTKIECQRCQEWTGELGQFKSHRGKNCNTQKQEQQMTQNCIEIVDNDVVEPKTKKKVKIDQSEFQQNLLIQKFHQVTKEIANWMFYNSLEQKGNNQQDDMESQFDESLQLMNESEIREFKISKKYLQKQINILNDLSKSIMQGITEGNHQDFINIQSIQLSYYYLSALQIQLKK